MNVNFDIKNALKENAERTERELSSCFREQGNAPIVISEAQKYSLLGGGKRIRSYLVHSFCRLFGGTESAAKPLACAIEMIHAYSLIHDDLPCMDNDDYRRGKPTNHKMFGEATAVLAGDALLTKAFQTVAQSAELSTEDKLRAITELSLAAGDNGMIGGQVLDMEAQADNEFSISHLIQIHSMKTGALIRAAAKLGCIAAGLSDNSDEFCAVDRYAEKIGLAFQVVDDLLDVVGEVSVLGKKTGADAAANKLTFLKFYSIEEEKNYAQRLTAEAIEAIKEYDSEGEFFALANYLLERIY